MKNYKDKRIIDGKATWVIVDEFGGIINRTPSEDELKKLKGLGKQIYIGNIQPNYNRTNTCDNIKEDGNKCEDKLYTKNAYHGSDDKGNWTGR